MAEMDGHFQKDAIGIGLLTEVLAPTFSRLYLHSGWWTSVTADFSTRACDQLCRDRKESEKGKKALETMLTTQIALSICLSVALPQPSHVDLAYAAIRNALYQPLTLFLPGSR